ncbi:hypothetical protein HOI83_00305 [Candidatus Uhrbacteria bacterium]|nr:hypothetical protein [Candidatus Uhrbacteria bacterium]
MGWHYGFWYQLRHPGVLWLRLERMVLDGFSAPKWWPGEAIWDLFKWACVIVAFATGGAGTGYLLLAALYAAGSVTFMGMPACMTSVVVIIPICVAMISAIISASALEVWKERNLKFYIYSQEDGRTRVLIDSVQPQEFETILFEAPVHGFFGKRSDYNGWRLFLRDGYKGKGNKLAVFDHDGQCLKFSALDYVKECDRVLEALAKSLQYGEAHNATWWSVFEHANKL